LTQLVLELQCVATAVPQVIESEATSLAVDVTLGEPGGEIVDAVVHPAIQQEERGPVEERHIEPIDQTPVLEHKIIEPQLERVALLNQGVRVDVRIETDLLLRADVARYFDGPVARQGSRRSHAAEMQ